MNREEILLMKFTKVFNYRTFISDAIRLENLEVIGISRAKVALGLRVKEIVWLRIFLEEVYYFHKMQPRINEMSLKNFIVMFEQMSAYGLSLSK